MEKDLELMVAASECGFDGVLAELLVAAAGNLTSAVFEAAEFAARQALDGWDSGSPELVAAMGHRSVRNVLLG